MFYFDKIDNKKILKSDLITNANAFFTTKDICICDKSGCYNNIVDYNKKLVSEYLNINKDLLITPEQTHSANIKVVKSNNSCNYLDTDSLIVTDSNIAIYLNFADCTPLIFYDKKQNIGAVTHAGWRGTAQNISKKTALYLIEKFDSNPEYLQVLIGPAICNNCYCVEKDVFQKVISTVKNYSNSFNFSNNKYYIDLKMINKEQLLELGITNIDICDYCTCCDNKYFYSYRKENATLYRHSAVLKLNN